MVTRKGNQKGVKGRRRRSLLYEVRRSRKGYGQDLVAQIKLHMHNDIRHKSKSLKNKGKRKIREIKNFELIKRLKKV